MGDRVCCLFVCLIDLFHLYPSVTTYEKATVALYFRRILTRLGVAVIQVFFDYFFDFFTINLLLVQSHQAEIIVVKRLIQGRNNAKLRQWELNLDHAM